MTLIEQDLYLTARLREPVFFGCALLFIHGKKGQGVHSFGMICARLDDSR